MYLPWSQPEEELVKAGACLLKKSVIDQLVAMAWWLQ